jgi:hypothetical protein
LADGGSEGRWGLAIWGGSSSQVGNGVGGLVMELDGRIGRVEASAAGGELGLADYLMC